MVLKSLYKNCSSLKLEDLGYSCASLYNQKSYVDDRLYRALEK